MIKPEKGQTFTRNNTLWEIIDVNPKMSFPYKCLNKTDGKTEERFSEADVLQSLVRDTTIHILVEDGMVTDIFLDSPILTREDLSVIVHDKDNALADDEEAYQEYLDTIDELLEKYRNEQIDALY